MHKSLPSTYAIFNPIVRARGGHIVTWGLSSPEELSPLAEALKDVSASLHLVIGYSRDTHNPGKLINVAKEWATALNGRVTARFVRNCHIKVWYLIDGSIWVGSANLVRNTLTNLMVRTQPTPELKATVLAICRDGSDRSRPGTDLNLMTTKRSYAPFETESFTVE